MKNLFDSRGKLHWAKNLYLRLRYGAGCCDVFSLNYYLAKKIVKPLKEFRRSLPFSHPGNMTSEEWIKTVDEMIWSFEFLLRNEDWDKNLSSEEREKLFKREQKGFENFGKFYRDLWL